MSKNSDKKRYPWQERKSSSKVCATSLESLRKQNTATNISTISSGDSSCTLCMLSIQSATQPLSEKIKSNINHTSLHNFFLTCNYNILMGCYKMNTLVIKNVQTLPLIISFSENSTGTYVRRSPSPSCCRKSGRKKKSECHDLYTIIYFLPAFYLHSLHLYTDEVFLRSEQHFSSLI